MSEQGYRVPLEDRIKKLEAENADLKRMVADLEKSLSGMARFQENEALKNLCKDMAGALEEIAKAYKEPTLKRLVDMLLEKFKEVMK